jgi:hypothetical protein
MHVVDLDETQFDGQSLIMSRMVSGLYIYIMIITRNGMAWHGLAGKTVLLQTLEYSRAKQQV